VDTEIADNQRSIMVDRNSVKQEFLSQHGWDQALSVKIPGDASYRKYERLSQHGESRILMDAPPEKESVVSFIEVAEFLSANDINAPKILAKDTENGFLLLEDFGNDSYSKVLSGTSSYADSVTEITLYEHAVDALIKLHQAQIPESLPHYNEEKLINGAMLMLEWYYPAINNQPLSDTLQQEYIAIWKQLLPMALILPSVVALRDYHADNLMWLPERQGTDRVGQLDFQDAMGCSPAYDLVSLLEDARRDVSQEVAESMINRYLAARPDIMRKDFLAAYAILGAQRNCRIVGVFARLAVRDHNSKYLSKLSRVWKHIENDMKHPLLVPLKEWFRKVNSSQSSSSGKPVRAS